MLPSDPLQAQITTLFRSRLVATAGAMFVDTSPDDIANDVNCKLSLDDPPPTFATGAVFSQVISQTLAQNAATGVALAASFVPAGAYLCPSAGSMFWLSRNRFCGS